MRYPINKYGEMENKTYFVYILASKKNGTLYIGVTNNLLRRIIEHKEKVIKGFTTAVQNKNGT
jgi:predicted GIY-YIG superfamily endonuclease